MPMGGNCLQKGAENPIDLVQYTLNIYKKQTSASCNGFDGFELKWFSSCSKAWRASAC